MKKIISLLMFLAVFVSLHADPIPDSIDLDIMINANDFFEGELSARLGLFWDTGDFSLGPTFGYYLGNIYGKEYMIYGIPYDGSMYFFMFGCKVYYYFTDLPWLALSADYIFSFLFDVNNDSAAETLYPLGILIGVAIGPFTGSFGVLYGDMDYSFAGTIGVRCPL